MANKKNAQQKGTESISEATAGSRYSVSAIKQFLREVKLEFDKIIWPNKKVTTGLTGFVLVLTVLLSIYLGSVDLILGKLISKFIQ